MELRPPGSLACLPRTLPPIRLSSKSWRGQGMSCIACRRGLLLAILPHRRRQQPQAVEDDENGAPLMADHRERQGQVEEQAAGDQHRHGDHRENQVLADDPRGAACQAMGGRQPSHVLRKQRDVGRLQRDVRACRSHGDADIRARQRSRIVHTVADERDLARAAISPTMRTLSSGSMSAWISSGRRPSSAPILHGDRRAGRPSSSRSGCTPPVAQRRKRAAEVARTLSATVTAPSTRASLAEIDHGLRCPAASVCERRMVDRRPHLRASRGLPAQS